MTHKASARVSVVISPRWSARVEYEAEFDGLGRRDLVLLWSGRGVRDVSCVIEPHLPSDVSVWRGHAQLIIGPLRAIERVTVRLTYSLDVPSLWPEMPSLRVIEAENLPRLLVWRRGAADGPSRLPLTSMPDTLVSAFAEAKGVSFLGPQFRATGDLGSRHGSVFSYFEGTTPFSLLAAEVDFEPARDEVSCGVLPSDSWDGSAPAVSDVTTVAQAIRHHFNTLFGDPAVFHRHILLFSAPSRPSLSLGSAILVNVCRVPGYDPGAQHWMSILGHEYAHTWWGYSTTWQGVRTGKTANEMIAIFLSHDALTLLDVGTKPQQLNDEIWAYLTDALGRSRRSLVKSRETSSGAYAASLLLAATQDRAQVVSALQALWAKAQSGALSSSDVRDVMNVKEPALLGDAVVDALVNPRPIVARVRVQFDRRASRWDVVLTQRWRTCNTLARRLRAARLHYETRASRALLSLGVVSRSHVGDLFYHLEPFHLISLRTKRWLAIQRRSVFRGAWAWAFHVASAAAPGVGHNPMKRLAAAFVALLLNQEDPLGWRELSRLSARAWPWASGRLSRAAACRATYRGEDDLRHALDE